MTYPNTDIIKKFIASDKHLSAVLEGLNQDDSNEEKNIKEIYEMYIHDDEKLMGKLSLLEKKHIEPAFLSFDEFKESMYVPGELSTYPKPEDPTQQSQPEPQPQPNAERQLSTPIEAPVMTQPAPPSAEVVTAPADVVVDMNPNAVVAKPLPAAQPVVQQEPVLSDTSSSEPLDNGAMPEIPEFMSFEQFCVKEGMGMATRYKEGTVKNLITIVDRLAAEIGDKINEEVAKVDAPEMPYKAQYVLEELIKRLQAAV